MDAYVLYLQSTTSFPSWTSRVRTPSPAPKESTVCKYQLHPVLRLCSVYITSRLFSSWFTIANRLSTGDCVYTFWLTSRLWAVRRNQDFAASKLGGEISHFKRDVRNLPDG